MYIIYVCIRKNEYIYIYIHHIYTHMGTHITQRGEQTYFPGRTVPYHPYPHPEPQTSMVRPVDAILTLLTFVTLLMPVKVLGTEKLSGCRNLSYLSSGGLLEVSSGETTMS